MLFYEVLVSSNFRLIEKWIYLRIMCVVINWSWLKYISIWTPILLLLFVCFFVCYFVTWSFSVFWTFCSDLWLVLSQEHRLWVINWSWLRYISIWTPILLLLFVCLFVLFCFLFCYFVTWSFGVFGTFCSHLWLVLSQEHRLRLVILLYLHFDFWHNEFCLKIGIMLKLLLNHNYAEWNCVWFRIQFSH